MKRYLSKGIRLCKRQIIKKEDICHKVTKERGERQKAMTEQKLKLQNNKKTNEVADV